MFTKEDVKVLRGMFQENNKVLFGHMDERDRDLKREIRDEMQSLISASEVRMIARIDAVEAKVDGLRSDILEVIDDAILPQIAELQLKIA